MRSEEIPVLHEAACGKRAGEQTAHRLWPPVLASIAAGPAAVRMLSRPALR